MIIAIAEEGLSYASTSNPFSSRKSFNDNIISNSSSTSNIFLLALAFVDTFNTLTFVAYSLTSLAE